MPAVRRVVLDLMKPYDPPLLTFARQVAATETVSGVTASLIESDRSVENVKLTLEGDDVDVPAVEDRIAALGGVIHSVDEVSCGERLVEERPTPQDTRS